MSLNNLISETVAEAGRMMTICNACRYCEGHCAVFPAMELRLDFAAADLKYLANLCHNCGSCFQHCQYAPPHEFNVNLPKALAEVRSETYKSCAWPGFLAVLFERNGLIAGLLTAVSLALVMVLTFALVDPAVLLAAHSGNGAFYAVVPHGVMAYGFGGVTMYVALALLMGFRNFWVEMRDLDPAPLGVAAFGHAVLDVLTMRNLAGGGDGCTYPGETPSHARRWFHHLTFYGFSLCFAATSVATVYHYGFGWLAPYAWSSLPVLLGTVGGVGLLIGPVGLLWLRHRAMRETPEIADPKSFSMDASFIVLLFLTSLTGLLLLVLRETPAMGLLLAIHLGVVLGLFVTLPYGKFVHAVYRIAALIRNAAEAAR